METDHHHAGELRKLFGAGQARLQQLASPGDFRLIGKVTWVDDSCGIDVDVSGTRVALSAVPASRVAVGDWLQFNTYGLSLWDPGL